MTIDESTGSEALLSLELGQILCTSRRASKGWIASEGGGLEWLDVNLPPDGADFSFAVFMERVDGLLVGLNNFGKSADVRRLAIYQTCHCFESNSGKRTRRPREES
jgi:hypothetical protein